jgi:hypothetical protein
MVFKKKTNGKAKIVKPVIAPTYFTWFSSETETVFSSSMCLFPSVAGSGAIIAMISLSLSVLRALNL